MEAGGSVNMIWTGGWQQWWDGKVWFGWWGFIHSNQISRAGDSPTEKITTLLPTSHQLHIFKGNQPIGLLYGILKVGGACELNLTILPENPLEVIITLKLDKQGLMAMNGEYTGRVKKRKSTKYNFLNCLYFAIVQAQGGEDGHWASHGLPRLCLAQSAQAHSLQVPTSHSRHLPPPRLGGQLWSPTGRTPPRHIHLLQQVRSATQAGLEKYYFYPIFCSNVVLMELSRTRGPGWISPILVFSVTRRSRSDVSDFSQSVSESVSNG